MTNCTTCRQDYDDTDEKAVKHHTKPIDCGQSCRCDGRPGCYTCGGSFCFCAPH